MKKNILLVFLFLASFAFTFPSFGSEHDSYNLSVDYLKFDARYIDGHTHSVEENGNRFEGEVGHYRAVGIGVGSYFGDDFRFELMGNFIELRDWDTVATRIANGTRLPIVIDHDYIFTLFLNGYRDFDFMDSDTIRPYVGGGIGFLYQDVVAHDTSTGMSVDRSDTGVGFSGGAGVCITLSENACLDLGYRATYFMFDQSETVHEARVGLRISGF